MNNKTLFFFIIIVIIISILFSCGEPGTYETADLSVVTGVSASRLEYDDHIRIAWNPAEDAESYRVYRYLLKNTGSLDAEFKSVSNVFDDSSAKPNTPYYYKVAGASGAKISELSVNYIEGIYSGTVDPFEPNNDVLAAQEVGGTASTAVIYSFNLGEAQDIDWYKFTGTHSLCNIKVTLLDSAFDGLLTLEIENNESSVILIDDDENSLPYSGSDDIYFSIYFTVPDIDIDAAGTYTVSVEVLL